MKEPSLCDEALASLKRAKSIENLTEELEELRRYIYALSARLEVLEGRDQS